MPINVEAGRGGWIVVTLHMSSGEELPFLFDTGTSDTLFDKSLESELGKPIGMTSLQSWGTRKEVHVYAMPKLYLGGVALKTGGRTSIYDLGHIMNGADSHFVGILGYDTLRNYCIQLDFEKGRMRFLDDKTADKSEWGKAYSMVALNRHDERPAVALNLLGQRGPHSLIDTGSNNDGWLVPKRFHQWTNDLPVKGQACSPFGLFDGKKYPLVSLGMANVESDGIGIRFLARHLVTLDFPTRKLYLQLQTVAPLPDPNLKTTKAEVLDGLINDVLMQDEAAASNDVAKIGQGGATELEKNVAKKLAATLRDAPKLSPDNEPEEVKNLPLGDAQYESAKVGWLEPAENRIPLNMEIASPLLDSGRIYATGLFAHSPSRYIYALGGKWKTLEGEAGLHTAYQYHADGVIFIIKADGKEMFRSPVIREATHARYNIDVTGVKTLELIVEKAQAQNSGNWALWLDPTLSR
ncbi:MAG TPA: NPCBM/NEW2 domain-containing protein [Verrucomicrobiae bacterium]